jgi:hypothetical protein
MSTEPPIEYDDDVEAEERKQWSDKKKLEWMLEEVEEEHGKSFGMDQAEAPKQESDVISAKMLRDLAQAGHLPEILRNLGLTENEISGILLRHGKLLANIVTNISLMQSMGEQAEAANKILYENNEIDLPQYMRNKSAIDFAKVHTRAVVNALSAVDGHRFEGLMKNIMSGKLAHENLQSEAEKKKGTRIARLKAWASGDRDI